MRDYEDINKEINSLSLLFFGLFAAYFGTISYLYASHRNYEATILLLMTLQILFLMVIVVRRDKEMLEEADPR